MESNETEKTIYNTALQMGVTNNLALLIVAQSKHETGNYTSSVFKTNKNCFGYKYVSGAQYQLRGAGKMSPEGNSYAAYASVANSAKEVAAWIKRHIPNFANITTPAQYALALKNQGYYGAPLSEYLKGLNKFYKPVI